MVPVKVNTPHNTVLVCLLLALAELHWAHQTVSSPAYKTSQDDQQDEGGCQPQNVCPIITPYAFNGEVLSNWDKWIGHFKSVMRVNQWVLNYFCTYDGESSDCLEVY